MLQEADGGEPAGVRGNGTGHVALTRTLASHPGKRYRHLGNQADLDQVLEVDG